MKILIKSLPILMVLSSCVEMNKALDIAGSIKVSGKSKSKRDSSKVEPVEPKPEVPKTPIVVEPKLNSKYLNVDILSCEKLEVSEDKKLNKVKSLTEKNKKVKPTIEVSADLLERIKSEIDLYVSQSGKISIEEFGHVVSTETSDKLNIELNTQFRNLSDEDFKAKRSLVVYSLLYLLEKEVISGLVEIKNEIVKVGNTSQELSSIENCTGMELVDIKVEEANYDVVNKTLCHTKKGSILTLTKLMGGDLVVDIKAKYSRREKLKSQDLYIDNSRRKLKIVKNNYKPKYIIELKKRKRSKESNSFRSLQLIRYEVRSRSFWTDKFRNIDCRTVIQSQQ